jgi:tRNA (guanine-N7-)-methyltransferase
MHMTRKSFLLRNVRVTPLDETTASRYLLHWHAGDLYNRPDTFPRITSQQLFGNDRPLVLEVGCGTGEFICAVAAAHPHTNFVGTDVNLKSLYAAVNTASALALDNILFIKAPVQYLYPLLAPGSLHMVYVHFPDPFLKPKHRKRRLLTPAFFDHMHRALVPGGKISIVTDNRELFMQVLELVENDPRFEKTHPERYLTGYEPEVKSRYQLYWEKHGATIYRLELRRKQG